MNAAGWLFVVTAIMVTACQSSQKEHEPNQLNCILLGYDSLATYYGSSAVMADRQSGKISDSVFINHLFSTARDNNTDSGLLIVLKPTAAADVRQDFKRLVDRLNDADLQTRSIDTLDAREQDIFHAVSMPQLLQPRAPVNLQLPGDQIGQANTSLQQYRAFTLLLVSRDSLYGYMDADMKKGKWYTSGTLQSTLDDLRKDRFSSVMVYASARTGYRATVNLLDLVKQSHVAIYSLGELSAKQETELQQLASK